MNNLLQRRVVRQFVKFGIVGLSSTAIDWGVFYLLKHLFEVYYGGGRASDDYIRSLAKTLSFLVAVINSFFWNRRWTFRSRSQQKAKEFSKFFSIYVLSMIINVGIMHLAAGILGWKDIFGLIAATGFTTFWNFFANKFWIFRHSQK
jgi:putative flippase GtrA